MATYNVTLTALRAPMDFPTGTTQGQWKFTCNPGAIIQFEDLPTTTFIGLAANTYTFTVQAFNVGATMALGLPESTVLTVPLPAPPDPDVVKKIIITDWYNRRQQVRCLLWAPVPAALQSQFATVGLASEWALASPAENDAIEAGEVAELGVWIARGEKSEGEVRAEMLTRWDRFAAAIQDAAALTQEDTFLVESGLWLRNT